jgi:hypothetical protein
MPTLAIIHVCALLLLRTYAQLGTYFYAQGWQELYVFTLYDHIIGDFPAPKLHYIYGSGQT